MNIVGEIKWYLGGETGNYAILKYSESVSAFSIDTILVPISHRGNGIGSTLIEKVICMSDHSGKDVYLSARPIGSSDPEKLEQLVNYYRKFGFSVVSEGFSVKHMHRPCPVA